MNSIGGGKEPRADRRRRSSGVGASPSEVRPAETQNADQPPAGVWVEVSNRQRTVPVDGRQVSRWMRWLLGEALGLRRAHLSVSLLGDAAMARLNATYVHHEGPTDVITFDYRPAGPATPPEGLWGEICVGVEEAQRQARRFGTTWPAEVARYLVHGVLHLLGYDDQQPEARRRMKREEDRLLRLLWRQFPREDLGGQRVGGPRSGRSGTGRRRAGSGM